MEDAIGRLAREMADAIAAAVSRDPGVAACHARARSDGYELQVSIEAQMGFSPLPAALPTSDAGGTAAKPVEMTAHDRRFLRSIRIAADETVQEHE